MTDCKSKLQWTLLSALVVGFLCPLSFSAAIGATRSPADPAYWSELTALPKAVAEVGVVALGSDIHVIAGTQVDADDTVHNASNAHHVFETRTGNWREAAPFPVPSSHVGVAVLDGKLYAVGGFADIVHVGPQRGFYVYDPAKEAWTSLPPLPTARGSIALVAVDGKLHAFGGRRSDKVIDVPMPPGQPPLRLGVGTVNTHDVYDPRTRRWSAGPPLPGPARDHMGAVVLGEKVHLFGGRVNDFSDLLDRHDIFSPKTGKWSSAAPLPQPRSAGAYAVVHGRIIYAGGECRPGGMPGQMMTFTEVSAYDRAQGAWRDLPAMPEGRQAFGAAAIGDILYLVGGAATCGGGASSTLWAAFPVTVAP